MGPGITVPKTIDRTKEPLPLIIETAEDLSNVILIDNNPTRPAVVILNGGSLKLKSGIRATDQPYAPDTDPGLGKLFNGSILPVLQIGFSHHDFARAFVVCMGSFRLKAESIKATTCVLVLANPDGTYGVDSKVDIAKLTECKFGVLATGQKNLSVNVAETYLSLWTKDDAVLGGGHVLYCNESNRYDNKGQIVEFLRVLGLTARLGKVRALPKQAAVRVNASPTVKFKGTWDVDYECLDDQNPCGAFDAFNSSGVARVNWIHPGVDAQNTVYLAFRVGDQTSFGTPNGNFIISGTFDYSKAPDQSARAFAMHTVSGKVFFATCRTNGLAKPDIYGMVNKFGLLDQAIPV